MSRQTILHVEDDENDVELFGHACRRAGVTCQVHVVADGQEAIDYLSGGGKYADRQQHPFPHLVLLDLKVPRINGFQVLAWLRKHERSRRLPVVVFSSSDHEADVRRAYELGANSYLAKPTDFRELVELAAAVHRYWLTLNLLPEV